MIVGLLFLMVQAILAFTKPRFFFVSYLIYITSFLGYLPNDILVRGYEIGLFFHSLIMISNYFLFYYRIKRFPRSVKILLNAILIFYLYGVLLPVLYGDSSIIQSIIASKEFSTLFFLHYLFIHSKNYKFNNINSVLSFLGYYFLFVLILFVLLEYIPPEYVKLNRPGQIEYKYPAILSLFLFIIVSTSKNIFKKSFSTILITIWAVGMFYEGHLAIMLTTTVGCLIILYRIPLIVFIKSYKHLILGIFILSLVLYLLPTDQIIKELTQTGSLRARSIYNLERLELIYERPFHGYGFIHHSAIQLGDNVYTESLSFIDSGYIDLLGKFGLIGSIIYIIILFMFVFSYGSNKTVNYSMRVFFVQYLFVNFSWSVLTFSMGTIALSLAIFLNYIQNINYNK